MDFTFYSAGEIIFGCGGREQIGGIAGRFGRSAMICVRGAGMEKLGPLKEMVGILRAAGVTASVFTAPDNEPLTDEIDRGAKLARQKKPDMIIALGGGSAIDTGKAISGLATNPGQIADYLEGVGQGLQISSPSLPCIAVPTTAGTGAEVTKNAVISSKKHGFKKSIRSPFLIPDVALLDPELTLSVPPRITAETGMDALTQLIESYVSIKAQPIPRALAIHGLGLAGRSLAQAVENGDDLGAREEMMLASLLSGLALANSGLGAAHGIAAALGALAGVPHGRACAMLIPHVVKVNLAVRTVDYAEIARTLEATQDRDDARAAESLYPFLTSLCSRIDIPRKFEPGEISADDLPELAAGSRGSSMKGNPVPLDDREIEEVIKQLL